MVLGVETYLGHVQSQVSEYFFPLEIIQIVRTFMAYEYI